MNGNLLKLMLKEPLRNCLSAPCIASSEKVLDDGEPHKAVL